jgi:CheY-like chemotaxis protein
VDKELETAAGAATADPVRVRQILTNLISNAVKYTVRGRIELRVQMQGQDRLRIEVADTGPGLNPEELSQAFAPFRRVDRTSMGVSGAGLGLSLSRDLARMMGGQVCADSAQGVGSRFWLELPFDPKGHLAPEPEPEEAQAGRGLRVLVAEGDALNAAMLRSVLEQLGHQVALASDGQRALDLAKVCAFDLLMIDGRTPNMNGAGVIRTLREATDAAAGMPIVAIIDGSCGDAQACTQAGADEVLRIPVSVSVVARALESAANARGAQRARVAVVKDAAA